MSVLLWDRAKRQKLAVNEATVSAFLRSNPCCEVIPADERRCDTSSPPLKSPEGAFSPPAANSVVSPEKIPESTSIVTSIATSLPCRRAAAVSEDESLAPGHLDFASINAALADSAGRTDKPLDFGKSAAALYSMVAEEADEPDKSEVLKRWENFSSECPYWRHLHWNERLYYFRKITRPSWLEKNLVFPEFQRMTKGGGKADGKRSMAGMKEFISGAWIDDSSQVHLRYSSREAQKCADFTNGDIVVLSMWRSMRIRMPGWEDFSWKGKLWAFRELCGVKWMCQHLCNYNDWQILCAGSGGGDGKRTVSGMRDYCFGHWPLAEDAAVPLP